MRSKNYELIEHTADIGIRVRARDLKEIFKNAASAMFDIMAEKKPETRPTFGGCPEKPENIVVEQKAENVEELFVNWLNELLSLSATKELIFNEFKIKKIDEHNLEAKVMGAAMEDYRLNFEIKAATYHALKIEKSKSGWQAEVILDV